MSLILVFSLYKLELFTAEELNALQNEQDIPIEELLKLYGYNNSQKDAVEKPSQEVENKTDSDPEEVVEPDVEVEAPQAQEELVEDAQKGEKRSSSTPPPSKKARSELAKYDFLIFILEDIFYIFTIWI